MSYLTQSAKSAICLALTIALFSPSISSGSIVTNELGASTTFALPLPPTYYSPANGATGLGPSVLLMYNNAVGALRYNVQVATDPAFKTVIYSLNQPHTPASFTAPKMGVTYYWRVNTEGAGGTSNWGAVWSFTTQAAVTGPPTLVYPKNGAQGVHTTVGLEFSSVAGATRYNVQVSSNAAFTAIVFAVNDPKSPVTFTAPAPGTYYWRVQAVGPYSTSAFSAPWSFSNLTTGTVKPVAPVLLAPSNGSSGQPVTVNLTFEPADGAVRYNVQAASDPGFTHILFALNVPKSPVNMVGLPGELCYWRVQAVGVTESSAFSAPWSFTMASSTEASGLQALSSFDSQETLPTSYALHENYPNPFNPSTTIMIDMPEAGNIKLAVYDLLGQEVMQIASGSVEAGRHSYSIDASGLSSGMYLYRIESAAFTQTRRMMLLK